MADQEERDRDKSHQRGEQYQKHTDAIDTEIKLDTNSFDPRSFYNKPHAGFRVNIGGIVELRNERERDKKSHQGNNVRDPLDSLLVFFWPQDDEYHSKQRKKTHDAEDILHKETHLANSQNRDKD